jgi:hypothetical protein
MVNNYSIYATDIKPKGFQVIEMDDFITQETVDMANNVLGDKKLARQMADVNYSLGLQYYSYGVLRNQLKSVLLRHWGDLKLENVR